MKIVKTSIAIAAILLLSPAASSTWSAAGNFEPSTPYDSAEWMWPDAPAPGQNNRVYFNAWAAVTPYGQAAVSPNVAALETQIETPANEHHQAVFGIWVDCNGDGYIGQAEQAMREYSATILLDDSLCPAITGAQSTWPAGAHNYNGWVSEYVPIAQAPGSGDKRVYRDDEAMVWGDYGVPDGRATFRSCALNPQPRGTYQSTGGFLNYVECRTQQNGIKSYEAFNAAMDMIGDPLGLRGQDGAEFDWRTTGLEMETLGTENDANSPATFWDCGSAPLVHVGDTYNATPLRGVTPLSNDVSWRRVYGVEPALGNTADPTVAGLVNHTVEGTEDCDTSNDDGHDTYGTILGEADFNGVSPNNKHEADWNFGFFTGTRGGLVATVPAYFVKGNAGSAPDGGFGWTGATGATASGWYADSLYLSKLGPRILKVDIESQTAGISPAWWLTFYAHFGATTASRGFATPGGLGVYGAAQCGDLTTGINPASGWNCDVAEWYKNPDGSYQPEPYPLARPGQEYELLDVDCYDGRLGDTGVGVLPAFYGAEPCP